MKTRSVLVAVAILATPALVAMAQPAMAFADTPPATTPTMVTAALKNGIASLAASTDQISDAGATVRFTLGDGAVLGDAAIDSDATGHTATLNWSTWGRANGDVTVYAEDCVNEVCGGHSDGLTLTIANNSPTDLAPAANVAVRGGFTLSANPPNGFDGTLRFMVDGQPFKDFSAGPYSTLYDRPLSQGRHAFTVVECDKAVVCDGPRADTTFSTDSLHPAVTSVSPGVLSPNHDGVLDTTKLTFTLPDTETTTLHILRGATVVRTVNLGTLGRGTHSWIWDGSNGRTRLGDGTYTMRIDTSTRINGITVTGTSTSRPVRIDTTAPGISSVTGNGTTFYPNHDGYLDTFTPAVTLGEAGTLKLTVYDTAGHVLSTLSGHRNAGRATITWPGTDTHGHRYTGSFRWTLTATDAYGNHRTTGRYSGTASTLLHSRRLPRCLPGVLQPEPRRRAGHHQTDLHPARHRDHHPAHHPAWCHRVSRTPSTSAHSAVARTPGSGTAAMAEPGWATAHSPCASTPRLESTASPSPAPAHPARSASTPPRQESPPSPGTARRSTRTTTATSTPSPRQ